MPPCRLSPFQLDTGWLGPDGCSGRTRISTRTESSYGFGVHGIDCGSTFAPVCGIRSIRMVLAVAARYDLECWQLDINTAFLNAELREEVYIKWRPGTRSLTTIEL